MNVKEVVKEMINCLNHFRGVAPLPDMHLSAIYILYCFHKRYSTCIEGDRCRFECDDDNLHDDLYDYARKYLSEKLLIDYAKIFNNYSRKTFDDNYVHILCELNDEFSLIGGRGSGEFFTPQGVSALLAYYLNIEKCKSIFDPFCGTASIVHYLKTRNNELRFEGQEIMPYVSLIARVNIEARTGVDKGINCTDSIKEWNENHFDAVCSCPPFGLKIPDEPLVEGEFRTSRLILENLIFDRAFHRNFANFVILLDSLSFTYRDGSEKWLRWGLVENNYLDTVISLPSNLLYGTSIPCVLMICKKNREAGMPVKFIHAEEFVTGESKIKRQFDVDSYIKEVENPNSRCTIYVPLDKIRSFDYNFNPALYTRKVELKEGQKYYPLKMLMNLEEGERTDILLTDRIVSPSLMQNDFIQVLLNANKSTTEENSKEGNRYRVFYPNGKKYLLNITIGGENRFYLHDSNESFFCPSGVRVFSVNKSIVDPKYLINVLLSNPAIKKSRMSLMAFENYPFVIDDLNTQKKLVNGKLLQYHARMQRIQESEAQRLGVKQNVSDLEHMLGSTQQKLNNIIDRLTRITPENEKYPEMVKQLKDNMDYMNRIIHYNNASIEDESLNIKKQNFWDFIENYLSAWSNYGGNYFNFVIENYITSRFDICFDKALFTVMLDSVLNNAIRHGFHKRKDYTPDNKVNFGFYLEKYKNEPYLVIRIGNNGDPLSDDFTIEDYITKGRFTSNTGRSGLGGYHVYQVVKGHKGYLALDSNKIWNVVVEILIPVTNVEYDNLSDYEHECI